MAETVHITVERGKAEDWMVRIITLGLVGYQKSIDSGQYSFPNSPLKYKNGFYLWLWGFGDKVK